MSFQYRLNTLLTILCLFVVLSQAAENRQKGVCWVGGPKPVSKEDFAPLLKNGVTHISQTPFGWQRQETSPDLHRSTSPHVWWGETDEGIRITTRLAQASGIKVMLKPHVWLTKPTPGKWRANIQMSTEAEWHVWFENYSNFILHYARLAEELKIELFCIGTELSGTTVTREKDWRQLIQKVRQVYSGQLTYAANWYQEYTRINFWDELDFIGIQAYFPLSKNAHPALKELLKNWAPYLKEIEAISQKYQKPVIFTEIGYRSQSNAASHPWEWIRPFSGNPVSADFQLQADLYEAFFQIFWEKPWFAGVYFWKWFPDSHRPANGRNHDFSPQFKPAEEVLRSWFKSD